MSDFYVDNRYYIDLTKIVFLELGGSLANRLISVVLLNGKSYLFYEEDEKDFKAYSFLKACHEKKIKEAE
jgi:hypothetical protein